jgi:hypothetical protein
MGQAADVKSTTAVRGFKQELMKFEAALRQILESLMREVDRGVEWVESDRTAYWPAQVRRASDRVAEARINLERCELATNPDDRRSCYEEKILFEQTKRRLRMSEEKVRETKRWLLAVRRESEEFRTRLAKLAHILEYDLPRAIAQLERAARTLERYAGTGPVDAKEGPDPGTVGP